MAIRPVFFPKTVNKNINVHTLVGKKDIFFKWFPGMAKVQKQKSIQALHESAKQEILTKNPLEISTKSQNPLGVALSAFNLKITNENTGTTFSVESAFQSSKVFEKGGPYKEIIKLSSKEAKSDLRLRESGELKYFIYANERWEGNFTTAFYDWLYINVLIRNREFADEVLCYDAFTDIEFNPEKSLNCQAHSVALYVALSKANILEKYIESKKAFERLFKFKGAPAIQHGLSK